MIFDACSQDINLLAIVGLIDVDLLSHVAFSTEDGSELIQGMQLSI
jgi:hypothetical protein